MKKARPYTATVNKRKEILSNSQTSLIDIEKKSLKREMSKRDVRVRKRLAKAVDKPSSRPLSGRSGASNSSRYATTTAMGFT